MLKNILLASLCMIAFSVPALSAEKKAKETREIAAVEEQGDGDIDCNKEDQPQQIANFCAMKSAQKAKRALAVSRAAAKKRIGATSSDYGQGFTEAVYAKAFDRASRAFHRYISAQCELEGYMEAGNGTLAPLIAAGCLQKAYNERINFSNSVENYAP